MARRILRRTLTALGATTDPDTTTTPADGTVTFTRKCVVPDGCLYTRGETATFTPSLAAHLVAQGFAKPGRHRIARPALPQPAPEPDPHLDTMRATVARQRVWFPEWRLE